jgi:pilus assembly protein Flp/PilA
VRSGLCLKVTTPCSMKHAMISVRARFAPDESGVTAIEYGLIAGLITILIIVPATQIGSTVSQFFAAVLAGFSP